MLTPRPRQTITAVTVLLCASIVMAGCSLQSDDPQSTATPAATQESASTPSIDPAPTHATTTFSPLIVQIKDLSHLAWGSFAIVHGRVASAQSFAKHPLSDKPPGIDGIFTDYTVEVLATYRGHPATSVTVRQTGGTVGNDTIIIERAAPIALDDEAIFFLFADPRTDDVRYLLGSAQGYWPLRDGEAVPSDDRFDPLPLHTLTAALAQYLRGDPPPDMSQGTSHGSRISLADAPLGEDLPLTAPWGALPSPTDTPVPAPVIDQALWDVVWRVVSIDGMPLADDERVTFSVFNGGRSTCNSYGAFVTMGPGNAFKAELGAQTAQGCETEALHLIETRYLSALAAASTFEISADGHELILRDALHRELRFARTMT